MSKTLSEYRRTVIQNQENKVLIGEIFYKVFHSLEEEFQHAGMNEDDRFYYISISNSEAEIGKFITNRRIKVELSDKYKKEDSEPIYINLYKDGTRVNDVVRIKIVCDVDNEEEGMCIEDSIPMDEAQYGCFMINLFEVIENKLRGIPIPRGCEDKE